MTLCYLGLGSNLRTPMRQLNQALHLLNKIPKSVILKKSSIYKSRPLGVRSQPQYFNMVIAIHTSLSAIHLLIYCQQIESKLKRVKKKHWGARTMDIDLLLYGEKVINHRDLTIPHPEMICRDFVLVPLLEISPNARLPSGIPLHSYLDSCELHLTTPTQHQPQDPL